MFTPRDVADRFRRDVDDPRLPDEGPEPDADSLWSDYDVYRYLDEAQAVLARRALLLTDNLSVPYGAGADLVELPVGVVEVRRVTLSDQRRTITVRNLNEMQSAIREDYGLHSLEDWETLTGPPRFIVLDHTPGSARLVPIPEKADELRINAFVEPAERIEDENSTLRLNKREHVSAMLLWMKRLAYQKHDADTYDLERAGAFAVEFERELERIYGHHKRRTRRVGTVRYGGL